MKYTKIKTMQLSKLKLKDITLKNIIHFFTGNIRYKNFKKQLSTIDFSKYENEYNWEGVNDNMKLSHVQEQFIYRMFLVDLSSPQCITTKACRICGCDTPQLFFAKKACEGSCYPELLNQKDWENYKKEKSINIEEMFTIIKHKI